MYSESNMLLLWDKFRQIDIILPVKHISFTINKHSFGKNKRWIKSLVV